MNRRDLLKQSAFLTGGALTAGMLGGFWSCRSEANSGVDWTPEFFTDIQGKNLAEVADRIIPRTDTPGAKDVGAHEVIDQIVKHCTVAEEQRRLQSGLDALNAKAQEQHGADFYTLSPADMDALLTTEAEAARDADGDHWWRGMKYLAMMTYFTSEAGATEHLQYEPNPGPYQGCLPLAEVGNGRAWGLE